jgi:hypothetical protein
LGQKNWDEVCDAMKVVHLWAQKTMVILETSWGTHHWDPMGTWLVGNNKNPPKKLNPHTPYHHKRKKKLIGLFHSIFLHLV